jgi:hypothetical protein
MADFFNEARKRSETRAAAGFVAPERWILRVTHHHAVRRQLPCPNPTPGRRGLRPGQDRWAQKSPDLPGFGRSQGLTA